MPAWHTEASHNSLNSVSILLGLSLDLGPHWSQYKCYACRLDWILTAIVSTIRILDQDKVNHVVQGEMRVQRMARELSVVNGMALPLH